MLNKITMIELFSGIGAQERAIRQLGIPYNVKHTCDCDANVVLSYAAMRYDFKKEMETFEFPAQDKMIEELQAKNLGYDFQKRKHTITSRTSLTKLKQYYLADKLSKNLGDINKVERLPYADLLTYSYPCTDISCSGKVEGMVNKCDKCGHTWAINFEEPEYNNLCFKCGNVDIRSTRSGLLGQVQRLLAAAYQEHTLPKYLLLENVKNLVGRKFKAQFEAWIKWLDIIGYNTSWKIENAKYKGIPQSRERVFAVSIRKDVDDGTFKFPKDIPLTVRLKDVLEQNVDEKNYLPDERIEKILNDTLFMKHAKKKNVIEPYINTEEAKVIKVGQASSDGSQSGMVYSTDGVAPTLIAGCHGYAMGNILVEQEPFIVASRGRNPNNPSDRTAGIPTEQRLEPNFSGCTNTLTSVQKDNYVCEPIIYDDYNSRISADQEAINTLTCNCGASAERNGVKIIEPVIIEDFYQSREPRVYQETAPTLRSERIGLKVADENIEYPCSTRGKQVASAIRASIYKQGARNLEENIINGLGYEGIIEREEPKIRWRIRKLTTKECWRLMGFSDSDHDKAAKYVSASALYKAAGNSICTCCLIAIFNALLNKDDSTNYTQYLVNFNN